MNRIIFNLCNTAVMESKIRKMWCGMTCDAVAFSRFIMLCLIEEYFHASKLLRTKLKGTSVESKGTVFCIWVFRNKLQFIIFL